MRVAAEFGMPPPTERQRPLKDLPAPFAAETHHLVVRRCDFASVRFNHALRRVAGSNPGLTHGVWVWVIVLPADSLLRVFVIDSGLSYSESECGLVIPEINVQPSRRIAIHAILHRSPPHSTDVNLGPKRHPSRASHRASRNRHESTSGRAAGIMPGTAAASAIRRHRHPPFRRDGADATKGQDQINQRLSHVPGLHSVPDPAAIRSAAIKVSTPLSGMITLVCFPLEDSVIFTNAPFTLDLL